MADKVIQIIIDLKDNATGRTKALADSLLKMDAAAARVANKLKALAGLKYQAAVSLIDRVTAPATRINSLLKKIAGGVYNVSVRLTDGALAGIRRIESSLARLAGKAYNIGVNVKGAAAGKLNGLMSGAMMGAGVLAPVAGMAGVGFGVANAVQSYAGFEKQMSRVQAVRLLDKESEEMRLLTEQAKELGKTTAWTRKQVGEAQYYQALAGWDVKTIHAATPSLLDFASATDLDLGRGADIATDLMTAFQLKPTDYYIDKQGRQVNAAKQFMDMIAKTTTVSNTNAEQLYEALKYAAPLFGATSANLSGQEKVQAAFSATQDALTMAALMADAGIKGSMAGTGMKDILQRMVSGNRNAFYGYGLTDTQLEDSEHNILPIEQIMRHMNKVFHEGLDVNKLADFVEAMDGVKIHADTRRKLDKLTRDIMERGGTLGTADMLQLTKMLGGGEHGAKLMAVLMGDWETKAAQIADSFGTTDKMARVMLDNLAGSFTYLGSAWDNFQQNLMEGQAGEGLRAFVDAITAIINRADNLFKDGIQIGDIGAIIGDVVSRLKNKFLELDGIGSVLAGGALMGALLKIGSTVQKVTGSIRNLRGGQSGSIGQNVTTMTIRAGVVNLYGNMSGGKVGKVGNTAIIDNYNRTKERIRGTSATPSMFSGVKSAAMGGAALAGVFGALDILNVRAQGAERLAQAPEGERAAVMRENRAAEWEASTGALGAVIGGALGAGLGSIAGPLGTMLGGVIGSMAGEYLGVQVGKEGAARESTREVNRAVLDKEVDRVLKPEVPDYFTPKQKKFDEYKDILTAERKPLEIPIKAVVETDSLEELKAKLEGETRAWEEEFKRNNIKDYSGAIYESEAPEIYKATYAENPIEVPDIGAQWAQLTESISETISAGMASANEIAGAALMEMGAAFTSTKEMIQSAWSELPGFFSGIFSGLGSVAAEAGSAIYAGLTSVCGGVIAAWEGVSGAVSSIISSISAAASSVADMIPSFGSVALPHHADGGFITRPEVAVIGEAGDELILPLSNRERSLELLNESGLLERGNSGVTNVQVDAVINVTGGEDVAEQIASTLAERIKAAFENRAVSA